MPQAINVFQPSLGAEELEAVRRVFESHWVGKGRCTERFEANFANHLNVPRELLRSTNSCTEGLFQVMALLEIGPDDEVILPSISFVGAANAVMARGARPVFCDVNPRTLNVECHFVEEQITAKTKAVIVLHYGGVPCPLEAIAQLAHRHGIMLIEDSACSVFFSMH